MSVTNSPVEPLPAPLLRQTMASERPFQLRTRGDLADVGSFRLAVHGHDANRRITLGVGFTSPNPAGQSLLSNNTVRELAFGYGWDGDGERPSDTRFSIDLDGYGISQITPIVAQSLLSR
ncbi:MAG: hypothetical protein ACOYD1_09160, partial [Candidatus Nanopelagicales bacterium]